MFDINIFLLSLLNKTCSIENCFSKLFSSIIRITEQKGFSNYNIKRMRKIIFLLLLMQSGVIFAQNAQVAKYKAMFTLNFIRYVGWPDAATKGDFVIGVLKNKTVLTNLQSQTVGKKFGYQNIIVKEFKKIDDVTDCQILFISSNINFSKNAVLLKQKLKGANSLIITDSEGSIRHGSMINFVVRDNKLKFEISSTNAAKFGLKFSKSLTSLSNAIVK